MPAATAKRPPRRRRSASGDSDRLTALHDTLTHAVHAAGLVTDDYSLTYVAGWAQGDVSLVRDTADRVIGTARAVLDRLAADTGAPHDVTAAAPERAK